MKPFTPPLPGIAFMSLNITGCACLALLSRLLRDGYCFGQYQNRFKRGLNAPCRRFYSMDGESNTISEKKGLKRALGDYPPIRLSM